MVKSTRFRSLFTLHWNCSAKEWENIFIIVKDLISALGNSLLTPTAYSWSKLLFQLIRTKKWPIKAFLKNSMFHLVAHPFLSNGELTCPLKSFKRKIVTAIGKRIVDELASSDAPPVLPSFLPSCKPLLQKPKQGIIAILDDHQVPIRSSFGKSSLLRTYWTPIFSDPRPSVQSSLDSLLPLFGVPSQAISQNNQLDKSLLKKIVMKSPKSSAGPDGIPFCFFKCQWKRLKVLLCKTVSEAALPDCLPISFNEAYIALIPKGKSICKPDEVRPITVTNSIYHIVGKYYVVGFIMFINQFISHTQQAIFPGRSIAKYLI